MKNNINLTDELNSLLFKDDITDQIWSPFLWKGYRRNDLGNKINCQGCNPSNAVGYIEGQFSCPYCKGEGYLYDEKLIKGYVYKQNEGKDRYNLQMATTAGKVSTTSYVLITPPDVLTGLDDVISILKLTDGKINVPITVTEAMKVIYTRSFKASKNDKEFNVAFLGG